MAAKLLAIIAKYSGADEIRGDSRLQSDLSLDSFDLVNIAMDAGEALGVSFSDKVLPVLTTVDDLIQYARDLSRPPAEDGRISGGKIPYA